MLNKRTNLLLTDEDYWLLSSLAREKGKTIGELIRVAVKEKYGFRTRISSSFRFN